MAKAIRATAFGNRFLNLIQQISPLDQEGFQLCSKPMPRVAVVRLPAALESINEFAAGDISVWNLLKYERCSPALGRR
jgi:hypothetical protein